MALFGHPIVGRIAATHQATRSVVIEPGTNKESKVSKGRPAKLTLTEYVNRILSAKQVISSGIARRMIRNLPTRFSIDDIATEVKRRGFRVVLGDTQLVFLLDRHLRLV